MNGDSDFEDGSVYNTSQPDQQFLNEALVKKAQLCETDIKPQAIQWSDLQSLSRGCINSWKKLWISAFDRTKILSLLSEKNYTQFESVLNLRIIMNLNKLQYEPFDLDNPVIISLQQQTEWDYRHFITRAENGYEIGQQHKVTMSSENTSTQILKDARQPQKKGRLFGLMD
jgi:hypothetical protein